MTQCLGLLSPMGDWYMAVAAAARSVDAYPKEQDLTVFKIPHGVFIKMHKVSQSWIREGLLARSTLAGVC